MGTKQLARCARVVSAERLAHVELLSVLCEPGGRAICCGQVSEDWNRCPGAEEVESCRGQLTPGTMASWAPNILVWDVLCRGRGDRCWSRFLRKSGRMSRTEGQRGKAVEGPGTSTAVTCPVRSGGLEPGAGRRWSTWESPGPGDQGEVSGGGVAGRRRERPGRVGSCGQGVGSLSDDRAWVWAAGGERR